MIPPTLIINKKQPTKILLRDDDFFTLINTEGSIPPHEREITHKLNPKEPPLYLSISPVSENNTISSDNIPLLKKLDMELNLEAKTKPHPLIFKVEAWLQEREETRVLLDNLLDSLVDLLDSDPVIPRITHIQYKTTLHRQSNFGLNELNRSSVFCL